MSTNKHSFTKHRIRHAALCVPALASAIAFSGIVQSQEDEKKGFSLELEEIIVTAQKREENSMTVPVTISTFSSQDIANTGAIGIQDIDDFMPGVEIGGSSTQTGITIRGVSSPNISTGGDPSTATFYDGSYMPRAITTIPFTDINRTEVLKGPQGTLFGRNSVSGVVNIIPNAPSNEFEARVKARVGNYGAQRLEGVINIPVSDTFAIRAAVLNTVRDGIIDNIGIGPDLGEEDITTARISALWNISDSTDIQFAYDMEDRDQAPRMTIGIGKYAYLQNNDPYRNKVENDVIGAEETRELSGYSIKINHEINDQWAMFATSSFREWDTTNLEDEDGTNDPNRYFDTNNIEESDIWYNEIRFDYVDDDLTVIFGANYSKEDLYQLTDVNLMADSYMQFVTVLFDLGQDAHLWDPNLFAAVVGVPVEFVNDDLYFGVSQAFGVALLPPSFAGKLWTENMENTGDFTNWGVFADATYWLTETVSLSAGLRYSKDEKEYSWKTYENTNIDWPFVEFAVVEGYNPKKITDNPDEYYTKHSDSDSWSKVTGRLILDWQFTESAMAFASIATGYKSGGFDGQLFTALISGPFDPEEMTNYEVGIKGDLFDDSVRLEAALFYQELDNRQQSRDSRGTDLSQPPLPTTQPTVLSGDEETKGIEIIVTWNVRDNLRLTALTSYREKDAILQTYYNGLGEIAGGENESTNSDNDYTIRFDWTPLVPVGSLLVHVDYVFDEDNGELEADAAQFYLDEFDEWYFQDKKKLSARISWLNDDENLEIGLWGKNLLDNEYAGNPGGFVADFLGAAHTSIEDPLTWGVDVSYDF